MRTPKERSIMRVVVGLILLLVAVVATAAPPKPTFSQDWSGYEADEAIMHQGQYSNTDSAVCCNSDSNCEIQVQSQSGMNYVDATNQRTRFDQDGQSQYIITLCGKIQKEMLVENDKCIKYCPAEVQGMPCEVGGFGIDPNATFAGTTTINGTTADIWSWEEKAILNITMSTTYFYVNQADPSKPIPLKAAQFLTPFGMAIGSQNSTWSNWTPGTPSPDLFKVTNIDSCPQDPQCGSGERQADRLRQGRFMQWLYYKYGPEAEANTPSMLAGKVF